MQTYSVLVADDEPLALSLVEKYVKQIPFLQLIGSHSNALSVLEQLEEEWVDILILDIQMPNLSGMQLAQQLAGQGHKIIFTTAFEQYAIQGYKVNAVDYLLKPFAFEELLSAAQKAKQQLQAVTVVQEDYLILKSDYKLQQIALDDILYIEGLKDYVRIHRRSTDKSLLSLLSMKSLQARLPRHRFMRVHRSYIVNLDKISTIERGQLIFGKQHIPVSDKYKEAFQGFIDRRSV
ncbi:LytR/AlgR family response regulator transcription factor [Saprospira grandis]|uniref:Two component transcriptional regulator, LytTR family protein n=1 Tax=Saprospira grandis (strain Lewin) TaxID=984262 RepID=H6L546_SAPGL|nr:response regulator transcription factor [Saprospira grandis]AFC22918.1 two component transcriptional regulator, LytTR family protein [Saprospira grandis str. Lewin]